MEGRVFSQSNRDGVQMMLDYLKKDEDVVECLELFFSTWDIRALEAIIRDPSNLAVLVSDGSSAENFESCDFSHFWIYRTDGRKLMFVVDHAN
jgi:hypothetical protein